jgi:hypothetical protein
MRFPAGTGRDTHQTLEGIGRRAHSLLRGRPEGGAPLQGRWRKAQRGQGLVLMTLAFVGILAFVGFAVDAGVLYVQRVRLGKAVDSAALAGAYELPHGAGACARVSEYLESHGYDAGLGKDFLYQLSYPDGGEFTIDSEHNQLEGPDDCANWSIPDGHYQIRVTGILNFPTNFLQLAGIETMPVVVSATAQLSQIEDVIFTLPLNSQQYEEQCMVDIGTNLWSLGGNDPAEYACTNAYDTSSSDCEVLYEYDFNTGETVEGDSDNGYQGEFGSDWITKYDMGEYVGAFSPSTFVYDGAGRHASDQAVYLGIGNGHGTAGPDDPPRIVHAPGSGFDPSQGRVDQEDLFVTFYVKGISMEDQLYDRISVSYADTSDAGCNLSELNTECFEDGDNWGTIMQVGVDCDPATNTCQTFGSCEGPMPDNLHDGRWPVDSREGDQEGCYIFGDPSRQQSGPPYSLGRYYQPQNVDTDWQYVIFQMPEEAFTEDPLNISLSVDGCTDCVGGDDNDRVAIDDLKIISCPMKNGPVYWYRSLPGYLGSGCYAVEGAQTDPATGEWWNCETELDDAQHQDTDLFPGVLNMFPARKVMQQPLYDIMLSIAGPGYDDADKPTDVSYGSYFNAMDPCVDDPSDPDCVSERFKRVAFTTFAGDNSAHDTQFPQQALTTDLTTFWDEMFLNERAHLFGLPYWVKADDDEFDGVLKEDQVVNAYASYTGGIYSALELIEAASPESDKPAIVLISPTMMNYSCSWWTSCAGTQQCFDEEDWTGTWGCKNTLDYQLQRAADMGVKIFAIGIRSEDAPQFAGRENFYARDTSSGSPIMINGEKFYYMDYISQYTGGESYYVDSTAELQQTLQEIAGLMYVHLVK